MAEGIDPAVLAGRQAVVGFPARVDESNAARIGEQLLMALDGGAGVVIADLSATASCDRAGIDRLARAYQQALVRQAELRLVVTGPVVRQMVSAEGLDRLVAVYPSLEAAVAAGVPDGRRQPMIRWCRPGRRSGRHGCAPVGTTDRDPPGWTRRSCAS